MANKFNMSDVMISYSRRDKPFVQALTNAIKKKGLEPWVDWDDIAPTVDWWAEIKAGIEAAHCFVFIISPNSVSSPVCYDEIEHAVLHNKRIIPVLYQDVIEPEHKSKMHAALSTHNWIYFRQVDDQRAAFKTLLEAIATDFNHTYQHTRLLVLAAEWNERRRPNSFLLRGEDLRQAEEWLSNAAGKTPQPTDLQGEYILASRKAAAGFTRLVASIATFVIIALLGITSFAVLKAIDASNQARIAQDALAEAQVANANADEARQTEQAARQSADTAATGAAQAATDEQNALYSQSTAERGQEEAEAAAENASELQATAAAQEATALAQQETAVAGRQTAESAQNTAAALQQTAEAGLGLAEEQAQTAQAAAGTALADANAQATQAAQAQAEAENANAQAQNANAQAGNAQTQAAIAAQQANAAQTEAAQAQASADAAQTEAAQAQASADAAQTEAAQAQAEVAAANATATMVEKSVQINSLMLEAQRQLSSNRPLALHLSLLAIQEAQKMTSISPSVESIFYDIIYSNGLRALGDGYENDILEAVAYSPDGSSIVSASGTGVLEIWHGSTGERRETIQGHSESVNTLVYSPDGQYFVSGSDDDKLKIWRADGTVLRELIPSQLVNVNSVDYYGPLDSADTTSPRYVAAGLSDGTIHIWDALTWVKITSIDTSFASVNSIAFNSNGVYLASAGFSDAFVELWQTTTGDLANTINMEGRFIGELDFHPEANFLLAIGLTDGKIESRGALNDNSLFTLSGHTNLVSAVAFGSDNEHLVSGSWDSSVRIWDIRRDIPELFYTFTGHLAQVNDVAHDAAHRHIASVSHDNTLRIWEWEYNTGELQHKLPIISGAVNRVLFSSNENFIAASNDGYIHIGNANTGQYARSLQRISYTPLTALTLSPSRNQLVVSDLSNLFIFNGSGINWVLRDANGYASGGGTYALAYHPNGNYFANGSFANILIHSSNTVGTPMRTLSGHSSTVHSLAFNGNLNLLASGSADKTIRIWDVSSANPNNWAFLKVFTGHSATVTSLSFSPDGVYLASGSSDNTVRIWNLRTNQLIRTITASSNVTSLAYSLDGRFVIAGNGVNSIQLWDVATGTQIQVLGAINNANQDLGHTEAVNSIAISPDGRHLVSGGADYKAYIWNIGIESAISHACDEYYIPPLSSTQLNQYSSYGVTANHACADLPSNTTLSLASIPQIQAIIEPSPSPTLTASPTPTEMPSPSPTATAMPFGYLTLEPIYGNWQALANAAGFIATDSASLLLSSAVDLSAYMNPTLRFVSLRDNTLASAVIQVSVNDGEWQFLALAANEDTRIDLSAYRGQVLRFQFAWLPAAETRESWQVQALRIEEQPVVYPSPTWIVRSETTPEATAEQTETALPEETQDAVAPTNTSEAPATASPIATEATEEATESSSE